LAALLQCKKKGIPDSGFGKKRANSLQQTADISRHAAVVSAQWTVDSEKLGKRESRYAAEIG